MWYEDVDAAPARQEVSACVESSSEPVVWLERERAWNLLSRFGILSAAPLGASSGPDSADGTLEVQSDPSFGPLVRILRPGRAPVVRITPLTDRDIHEMLDAAGLPADVRLEELLGRLSQMIEELPWLCEMSARVQTSADGSGQVRYALAGDLRIGFCRARGGTGQA